MKRDTKPNIAKRAELMRKMEQNVFTRGNGCGVLTDDQLVEWLSTAHITLHPDDFGGFEILFGFDEHGQDFVVIKNKEPNRPNFAIVAEREA
jgi:hypothetical protein